MPGLPFCINAWKYLSPCGINIKDSYIVNIFFKNVAQLQYFGMTLTHKMKKL
jgi:hypothetical protein